jgi:16S rRNA (cytosine1402-N4)-methyltransferase
MRLHARQIPYDHAPTAGYVAPRPVERPLEALMSEHEPVLAPELVSLLAPEPGQTAVDCTFGGGGHARRVAELIGPEGTLIGIDRDPAAEKRFNRFATEAPCRTLFIGADFSAGLLALQREGVRPDMVYMDLGMSSMQVDARERGFSYSYDAPLDMRMDTRQEFTAADLLNEWPEARIAQVLRRFGEERHAGGVAREIVRRRPLKTTSELVEAVPLAWAQLKVGGRFAAISFHSLEDRPVKQFLAAKARGCICPPELPVCVCGHEPEAELLTRRAISPGPEEAESNPRSRSAHLRAALKIAEEQPMGKAG